MVKLIRYSRILKHGLIYILTNNVIHLYEVQHYYYMKTFNKTNT